MTRAVKIAFVGTGDVFLKYYLPEGIEQDILDVVAICDVDYKRAETVANFVGNGCKAYGDYQEMLDSGEVEMVVILTPPTTHYPLAMSALENGIHAYVEKPFCRHLSEADKLIEAANAHGVKLMAAPTLMLDPPNKMMREMISEGAIGHVAFATDPAFQLGSAISAYMDRFVRQLDHSGITILQKPEEKTDASWYYQKGGGPVYDLAVYSITRMTGLIGPAKRVFAYSGIVDDSRTLMQGTESERSIEVTEDDNTSLLLDMGASRFVHINAAWHGGATKNQGFEVIGSKGTITQSSVGDIVTRENSAMVHIYRNESKEWQDIPVKEHLWWIPTGVTHLADCISRDMETDISVEQARHVVEIMEKIYIASKTGESQEITTVF